MTQMCSCRGMAALGAEIAAPSWPSLGQGEVGKQRQGRVREQRNLAELSSEGRGGWGGGGA